MSVTSRSVSGLLVRGPLGPDHEAILTPDALDFVGSLVRDFAGRRDELLERRRDRQLRLDAGERPHFLPETRAVREASWTVAPLPADLQDRRVEITGPVDRKMIINALNSGASVFMADFEDANSPTWDNVVHGQQNLHGRGPAHDRATRRRRPARSTASARRPRCSWSGRAAGTCRRSTSSSTARPIPASLFDFGLYFFHNAQALLERGTGPYFYLPKLESHLEARLWNDVFLARAGEARRPARAPSRPPC